MKTSETDTLYLTRPELDQLKKDLRTIVDLTPDLQDALIKLTTKPTTPEGFRAGRVDIPLPFSVSVSEFVGWAVKGGGSIVSNVCSIRGLRPPVVLSFSSIFQWLLQHANELALVECAPEYAAMISRYRRRTLDFVDLPRKFEFIGGCQSSPDDVECGGVYVVRGSTFAICQKCGERLNVDRLRRESEELISQYYFTKSEIRESLQLRGFHIPTRTFDRWIAASPAVEMNGKMWYPLTEIVDKARQYTRRRRKGFRS